MNDKELEEMEYQQKRKEAKAEYDRENTNKPVKIRLIDWVDYIKPDWYLWSCVGTLRNGMEIEGSVQANYEGDIVEESSFEKDQHMNAFIFTNTNPQYNEEMLSAIDYLEGVFYHVHLNPTSEEQSQITPDWIIIEPSSLEDIFFECSKFVGRIPRVTVIARTIPNSLAGSVDQVPSWWGLTRKYFFI